MNIRKGVLRLALVLSILAAIILPLSLMQKHPWVTCRVMRYEYEKEEIDKAEIEIKNRYPQPQKRSGESDLELWARSEDTRSKIYELLKDKGQWYVYEFKWTGGTTYNKEGEISIMASMVDLVGICDEISKDYIEGHWKEYPLRIGGFYPLGKSFSSFSRGNKFFDDPDYQKHLRLVDITTHINWKRFFLVMGISFASVWFLYVFVRLVFIGFILEGFKNKSLKGDETE
jgi:hypothetical protein